LGIFFGLFWVGLGLFMPFLSEVTAPGMSFLLKVVIGAVMLLFGGFIIYAVCRNMSRVLEVDLANRTIRSFATDRNDKRHGYREIAFRDITGVFGEWDEGEWQNTDCAESLIINYDGRPGRLYVLAGRSEQIVMVRDFILIEALHRRAAPVVDGVESFLEHAKWAFQQRMR
jgi:hypothetical protein